MITSIDAEKGTWKNLISLYDNNSMKRVKKKCNNVIKAIYNKLIANNILSGEKLKTFPLRSYNHVSTWPMKKMRNVEFFCNSHRANKWYNWEKKKEFRASLLLRLANNYILFSISKLI